MATPDEVLEKVPDEVVATLRAVCLALPQVVEEKAWLGTRWRVRGRTFAHVLLIDRDHPPVYAKAVGPEGPTLVLTFDSDGDELAALVAMGHPFYRPPWRRGIVLMVLEGSIDWDEVAELVTESYCVLAPAKLAAQVERPDPA